MNKNKIILSAFGGVAAIAVAVLGYMSFSEYSERSEKGEDLEIAKSNVERIQSAKIAPVEDSIKAIDERKEKLSSWQTEALALASQGDWLLKSGLTAAAFKQEMVDDARELAKLPGTVNGAIVAENFGFGFNEIITGGKMPDSNILPLLQRQWAEIKLFVEMFSNCGVGEIKRIAPIAVKVEAEEETPKARKNKKKEKVEEKAKGPTTQSYEVTFLATPASFVRVLNAIGVSKRFITVDSFSFMRATDSLAAILGTGKESASTETSSRRQRGRRAARNENADGEENAKEEVAKKGLVTDPATAVPLTVTLKLSTFDFGTKAEESSKTSSADGNKGEEEE